MKIIDISGLRIRKINKDMENLREFDDYYEYCFIKEYEMKYDDFKSQSVQIGDIFVNLLEMKTKTLMVSLLFPKTFDVHEIAEWLNGHQVIINKKDNKGYYVPNASSVLEALMFRGLPIVIAGHGKEKIYFQTSALPEVTEQFEHFSQIVNTALAKPVDITNHPKKSLIYLNCEKITTIPRIDFNLSTYEIYVNDAFIVAHYLDEYGDGIGFYREEDSLIPILFFVGTTPINIVLEENIDGGMLCVVEQESDIEDRVNAFRQYAAELEMYPDPDDCLGRTYPGVDNEKN